MGIDKSETYYQALLIPDERVVYTALDRDNSTATEAGPRPGSPVPDQDTSLVLVASGEGGTVGHDLRCQLGGTPGRDGARFLWKPDTAGSTQWRGWDPPLQLSGYKVLDAGTTALLYRERSALALASGVVLCAAKYSQTTVRVWSVSASGSTSSSVDVYTKSSAYSDGAYPCMLQLPSGRVLLFFLLEVGTTSQLSMYYSDDDGATWTLGQRAGLSQAISRSTYDIKRMRVARLGDQLCLVVSAADSTLTRDDIFLQFASDDLGANWTRIDVWAGTSYANSGAFHELVTVDGSLVMAYLRDDDGTGNTAAPFVRRIGSAWDAFSGAADIECQPASLTGTWGTLTAGVFDASGALALVADDDGTLYLLGRDEGNDKEGILLRSIDGGLSWGSVGVSGAAWGGDCWYQWGEATYYAGGFAAAMSRGRVLVFCGLAGSPNYEDSLMLLQLGGYTDREWPRDALGDRPDHRSTWGYLWMPWDVPGNVGAAWTPGTSGAPTVSLTGGYLHLSQTGAQSAFWTANPSAGIAAGLVVEFECDVQSGTAYMTVGVSDGANGYTIRVSVTSTQMVVRDVNAGTDIATVSLAGGELDMARIRIAIRDSGGSGAGNDGQATVWSRAALCESDRDWGQVVSTTSLQSAAAAANSVIVGGVLASAEIDFGGVFVGAGSSELGVGFLDVTNPDDLQGRCVGAVPVYVDDGVSIRGVDGPGYRGDTWSLTPAHDHGMEYLHHEVSRSPRRTWRSTNNAADCDIRWTFATEAELQVGELLGVYLGGCNFRTAELHGLGGGGAYVKLCDISLVKASSLTFTRYGNSVIASDASGNSGGWLPENGCAGWTWKQRNATPADVFRKVLRNSAGAWGPGTHLLPRLMLEGAAAADASSGTNGELWSSQVLVIVHDATQYKGFKLVVPAQDTADGYREIGVCLIGRVVPMGQAPSWSRQLGWESTAEVTTRRNGARSVHAPAPVRRRVSFSWDEPVDTSELFDAAPQPSWITGYTGGRGVAAVADSVLQMGGLLQRIEGAKTPVVYMPRVVRPAQSTVDLTLVDSTHLLYGAIASQEFLADQSLGNELTSPGEMLRGGRVTIEEEL